MTTPAQKKLVNKRLADIREANNMRSKLFKWTGFTGKTLWDWLQLLAALAVPLALGLATYSFNLKQADLAQQQHDSDQRIAADNRAADQQRQDDQQRETALRMYVDSMQDLLLNRNLRQSKPSDEVRVLAQARTLSVLRGLDPKRKADLLQFLYESGLVNQKDVIIDLKGADLSAIDLFSSAQFNLAQGGTDLNGINLSAANLNGAKLMDTLLFDAELSYAYLSYANLFNADLSNTDLSYAYLNYAHLESANLTSTQLINADLRGADLWWTRLSRQKKYACEDTKSSFADEKCEGTNVSHVPPCPLTVSFFGLLLNNCTLIHLAKIDSSRGLIVQRLM